MGDQPLLWAVRALKLLAEVALLAELGRLVLGRLLGARRDANVIYGVFRIVTAPAHRAAGWLVGASPSGRQKAALVLLFALWLAALAGKVVICLSIGVSLCR